MKKIISILLSIVMLSGLIMTVSAVKVDLGTKISMGETAYLSAEVPENGKYTLRISFRGKPGQSLNYELATGADGSAAIRKSETARNFGYLNLSLNLSLNPDPEKVRNAVRNLHR